MGYKNVNEKCVCNDCWKLLRAAIDSTRVVSIVYGDVPNDARTSSREKNFENATVHIDANAQLEYTDVNNVSHPTAPFSTVLWHETFGHWWIRYTEHLRSPVNVRGNPSPYQDPAIKEENIARNCLRKSGRMPNIPDRNLKYYKPGTTFNDDSGVTLEP